jgi:hypothetical protein
MAPACFSTETASEAKALNSTVLPTSKTDNKIANIRLNRTLFLRMGDPPLSGNQYLILLYQKAYARQTISSKKVPAKPA